MRGLLASSVVKRVLLRLLVVGKVRHCIFVLQVLDALVRRGLRGPALGLVISKLVGGVEVSATSVASKLVGSRTCWTRHAPIGRGRVLNVSAGIGWVHGILSR